jgi:endonuclease YncB( thermonuclease family)
MKCTFITCLFILLFQNIEFDGKVIGIVDGDTIIVLNENNEQIKIRLEGIDCPESNQDFGNRAKQEVSGLCFKKNVHVIQSGTDRYGRMLANIYLNDLCINKELLKRGMAWHFKKYNSDAELAKLEIEARKEKIGLWSHPNPEAPWDFRARKK